MFQSHISESQSYSTWIQSIGKQSNLVHLSISYYNRLPWLCSTDTGLTANVSHSSIVDENELALNYYILPFQRNLTECLRPLCFLNKIYIDRRHLYLRFGKTGRGFRKSKCIYKHNRGKQLSKKIFLFTSTRIERLA